VSILDDFEFYEEREKALLENKARLHHPRSSTVVEPKKPLTVPTDLVGHITKSFAQAVRLGEAKTVNHSADKGSAGDSSILVKPIEVKQSGLS
jgi:YTH domain-containing family protein